MANIEGIINTIKALDNSIEPVVQTVIKNTVAMTAICMKTNGSNIAPCIYIDKMLESDITDEDAANLIMQMYHKSGIDIDTRLFTDPDYILNHLYIGLQKQDDRCDYITRDSEWDDIIEYMYVRGTAKDDTNCSVKLTKALLDTIGISEETAWQAATKATANEIEIESMTDVINDLLNTNIEIPEPEICEMWVASNALRLNGAAVVTNSEYIKSWAQEHGYDKDGVVLIFSSIHEAILLPAKNISLVEITNMINNVNAECVDAIEQLADRAYLIQF